jgi:hypothetical protein
VSFWRGFVTAILVIEWLVLGWLVRAAPAMKEMVAEFGASVELPRVFVLVTSTGYAIGCLAGLVVAAVIAGWLPRRPGARVAGLASVAGVAAGVIALTWYGLYSPIFMLTGNIR